MSGLYNMLFGKNEQAPALLAMLGLENFDFGRYRDTYVTEDHIVVLTRCGGGNREDYEWVFASAAQNPYYAYDEDSDFDCTYAEIYFRHPPEFAPLLKEMAAGTVTPDEKWKTLLENLNAKK